VQSQAGEQREGRPFLEFAAALRPLLYFAPSMGSLVEKMKAQRVANRPVVEVAAPAVHLGRSDFCRLIHKGGEHASLVPSGLPECSSERVVASQPFAQISKSTDGDSEYLFGADGVARHAFDVALVATPLQPGKRPANSFPH
jgi:hypothetical protein